MTGSVMANAEGVNPSRHEIELQLERMLAHPLFEARAKQARIFAFLVNNALGGKQIDEKDIFQEFFTDKRYAEGTTSVRTNIRHIRRELLESYYKGDGKDDPVIIALPAPERSSKRKKHFKVVKRPAGKAYAPEFSYNPRAPIAKQFAIANHLLTGSPEQVERALWKFNEIDKAAPNHPDAILGLAETVACQMLLGVWWKEAHATLIAALLAGIKAIEKADAWRVHNVRGVLHTIEGNFIAAKKEFGIALRLDRGATIKRGWYTLFLQATGKAHEAAKLQGLNSEEDVSNAQTQAVYGLYLLKAGQLKDAERTFTQSLTLDRNCWLAHLGIAQTHLMAGNKEKAREHVKRLAALIEPAEFQIILGTLGAAKPSGRGRSMI
jgi:tetratricopeptide (TPR) repeat protein